MLLWLIKSELYCFGIRIQKIVLNFLLKPRANYVRLNNLHIKETTTGKNFHGVSFISKRSFISGGIFINFIVVVVFTNCSSL